MSWFLVSIIGFLQDYTVTEGIDAMIAVEITLFGEELNTTVTVRVFTMDGSAIGTGLVFKLHLHNCT